MVAREEESGEAAEGDGVHSPEIGVFLPGFVAVGPGGASERTEDHESEQQDDEELSAAEEAREDGEEEIEHFLDGERPQNIPVAGEVAAAGFEDVDVEGECGE